MTVPTGLPPRPAADWRTYAPHLAAALLVLVLGLAEAANTLSVASGQRAYLWVVALLTAAAIGLCRAQPAGALGAAWVLGVWQFLSGADVMYVEVALAAVAFACARWGSPGTLAASVFSIPVAAVGMVAYVRAHGVKSLAHGSLDDLIYALYDALSRPGAQVLVAGLGLVLLFLPWLAGLTLRFLDRARASRVSQEHAEAMATQAVEDKHQAEDITLLREQQAQLARDVHDVVGHSLATIIAQADAGQYAEDPVALRSALGGIATAARASLDDVRQVLATSREPASAPAREGDLDTLVHGLRDSGHEVLSTEHGTRRPLPPEMQAVAYRVLQEMLTNAIKHGSRSSPITVERHWEGELRIEVRNAVDPSRDTENTQPIGAGPTTRPIAGSGTEGMRRRLDSVVGRLDVRRRDEVAGATYTATAWIPLRHHG